MQLKTWVNVVLVLILLASCSAASSVSDIVNQTSGGSQVASQVAAKQEIDLDAVFRDSSAATQCQDAARGTSAP